MNESKLDTFILCEDASEQEKKYRELYGSVINRAFVLTGDLISKVNHVLRYEKPISAITDHSETYQLAYLLLHGVHDTCLSVREFYELFKYNKSFRELCSEREIRILCLAKESLFATVGACRMIDEAVVQFRYLGEVPTKIKVSIVDAGFRWKRLCKYVVEAANSYCKGVKLKCDFVIEDDLAINECDIVIMSKFLSQFKTLVALEESVKKSLREMKDGAILFYLDYESHGLHTLLRDLIAGEGSFIEVRCCIERCASFDKPRCEQYCLDFPFTWNTNFPPVIFLTWIKNREKAVKNSEKTDVVMPAKTTTKLQENIRIKSSKKSGNQEIPHVSPPRAIASSSQNQVKLSKKSGKRSVVVPATERIALQTEKGSKSSIKSCNQKSSNKNPNQNVHVASPGPFLGFVPLERKITFPPLDDNSAFPSRLFPVVCPAPEVCCCPGALYHNTIRARASATHTVASSSQNLKKSRKKSKKKKVLVQEKIASKTEKKSKPRKENKPSNQNQAKSSTKKSNQNFHDASVAQAFASSSQNQTKSSKKSRKSRKSRKKDVTAQRYLKMASETENQSSDRNVSTSETYMYKTKNKLNFLIELPDRKDFVRATQTVTSRKQLSLKSSKNRFPLDAVGNFSRMDLEKRYKDERYQRKARKKYASRYANFDE